MTPGDSVALLLLHLVPLFALLGLGGWLIECYLRRQQRRGLLPPPDPRTERPGSQAEFRRRMAARRWVA